MKRLYPTVVLAGMLALSLPACSSWRANEGADASGTSGAAGATGLSSSNIGPGSTGGRASDTSPPAGTMPASGIESDASGQAGSMGASGASGATVSSAQDQAMPPSSTPAAASTMPNSTVISIEPLASSSTGSSGASGASGSAGAGAAGTEQAYRITLRMDDGSTQVVSQATTPTYRSGDRVNLSSGVISR